MDNIGIVFGGGGVRGAYQLGVWKALREYGMEDKITVVSGNSVGALNAYLFSCGNIKQAEEIWRNDATKENFLSFNNINMEFSRKGLENIIDKVNDKKYLISPKKTFVCTYSENNLKYHDISGYTKEELKKLLLASSAISPFYKGVLINGEMHKDPFRFNNMPVEPVYNMGIRKIILVYLNPEMKGNNLNKFSGCKFLIVKPDKKLGSLFNFMQIDWQIKTGFADFIKLSEREKDMGKIGNAIVGHESFEIMSRIFSTKERLIEFCIKYNKTVKWQTMGGEHFWEDIYTIDGYKVQRKIWQHNHIRILDGRKFRIASFLIRDFKDFLTEYEKDLIYKEKNAHNGPTGGFYE